MQIPIKRSLERVPGGLMVVPLFLGAILHTLFPNTATFFGSFTGALFNGALPILAVFFVCMGAGIDFRADPGDRRQGRRAAGRQGRRRGDHGRGVRAVPGRVARDQRGILRGSRRSRSSPP